MVAGVVATEVGVAEVGVVCGAGVELGALVSVEGEGSSSASDS